MFEHMQERVTDLVFKAKMQVRMQKPPQQQQPQQQQQQSADRQPAPQQQQATPQQRTVPKPAEQSIRAASSSSNQGSKQTMTIGRNEIVTLMDPQSGKKETMKFKKAKSLLEQGWRLVND